MRILVTIPDEWVPVLDEKRGIATRTAWIRHQLEPHLKEAVAPLVPEAPKRVWKGTAAEWAAFQEGAGFETPEETEILDRMHGITSEATVGEIADALEAEKAKPRARRKRMKESKSETLKAMESVEKIISPQRCNRGACTGTIKPNGRCIRCNQEPLKESK